MGKGKNVKLYVGRKYICRDGSITGRSRKTELGGTDPETDFIYGTSGSADAGRVFPGEEEHPKDIIAKV